MRKLYWLISVGLDGGSRLIGTVRYVCRDGYESVIRTAERILLEVEVSEGSTIVPAFRSDLS